MHAGEVIGFVGNTGDAFTTAPHLHFEVHPRMLLHLNYEGAVDPTRYLEHWTHLSHVDAPGRVHPPLPAQPALRAEAGYIWRELLSARHLEPVSAHGETSPLPVFPLQMFAVPAGVDAASATTRARTSSSPWILLVSVPLATLLAVLFCSTGGTSGG